MAKWHKRTLKLAEDHAWEARPGYKIVVADRGAARFDIPEDWVFTPGADALEVRDRPPPDDDCLLQVTVLPPFGDGAPDSLPLARLLAEATAGDGQETLAQGPIEYTKRPALELAWRETRYLDPLEHREARSRTCLARGVGIHALLTLSFWPEDAARFRPVWEEILRSLRLGEYVEATTGRPAR